MLISFTLSMPNVASWNGKWTGEGIPYARVQSFSGKKGIEKAMAILKKGYFHYNFGDGWSAGVTVRQVCANEASRIRRYTKGFCGYDWMIDSIKTDLTIIPPSQRKEKTDGQNT